MWKNADLNVGDLTQTPEGRPGGSGGGGRDDVGSSADGLLASTAVPDANRVPLDGVLAAEGAVDLFVSLHFVISRARPLQLLAIICWLVSTYHVYLACWLISIRLTCFLREAPYLCGC